MSTLPVFWEVVSNFYWQDSYFISFITVNRNLLSTALMHAYVRIGNSMIRSDIWHKYHEWYFKIVMHNLRQFWNITSGVYAKYHVQIMLLIVYTTTLRRFVIFTCRYFKLSWNTTALSQSNCRNFSCSSIRRDNFTTNPRFFLKLNSLLWSLLVTLNLCHLCLWASKYFCKSQPYIQWNLDITSLCIAKSLL